MVEIEIGVLCGRCLDRQIGNAKRLASEIAAWQNQRNNARARIKWMFATDKARSKMARAYPPRSKSHNHCAEILERPRIRHSLAQYAAGHLVRFLNVPLSAQEQKFAVTAWKYYKESCEYRLLARELKRGRVIWKPSDLATEEFKVLVSSGYSNKSKTSKAIRPLYQRGSQVDD